MKKFFIGLFSIFILAMSMFNPADAAKWNKNVVTVYIQKDAQAGSMRRAFEVWEHEFYGNMQFKFLNQGPADINVLFTDKVDGKDGPIGQCNLRPTQGDEIKGATIRIVKGANKKYSRNLVYTTMLHEVGHAIGLPHTSTPRASKSIMFYPISENQDIIKADRTKLFHNYGWSWNKRLMHK